MESLKGEIFRYLGYKDGIPDDKVLGIIDECLNEIKAFNPPKYVYKILNISLNDEIVIEGGLKVKSRSLKEHLKDCTAVAVMAATLGTQADLAMGKYNKIDVAKAVVFDACANAYIEQVCDNIEIEIKSNKRLLGLNSVFRFSPGYGDFSLEHQKDVLELLNAGKNIGLTLSDSFLLVPTKSVTAIVGFFKGETSDKKREKCNTGKCEFCNMKDSCNFFVSKEIK
jgi:hypothetical protein